MAVRDSKSVDGTALAFSASDWQVFLNRLVPLPEPTGTSSPRAVPDPGSTTDPAAVSDGGSTIDTEGSADRTRACTARQQDETALKVVRAVDDPATLTKAARIVRVALVRRLSVLN